MEYLPADGVDAYLSNLQGTTPKLSAASNQTLGQRKNKNTTVNFLAINK